MAILADEALNLLIAENIMGGERGEFRCPSCFSSHFGSYKENDLSHYVCHGCRRTWEGADCFSVRSYIDSLNIHPAWQVLEKMLERGFNPTVNYNGPPGHFFTHSPDWAGPWHCCFQNTKGCLHCGDESCKCYSHAEADTPARAICLAALKACGVEVSDAD